MYATDKDEVNNNVFIKLLGKRIKIKISIFNFYELNIGDKTTRRLPT